MTNEEHVGSGADGFNGSVFDRKCCLHATHFEVVADDEPFVADLLAKDIGDPFARNRSRCVIASDFRIGGVATITNGSYLEFAIGERSSFQSFFKGLSISGMLGGCRDGPRRVRENAFRSPGCAS